MANTFEKMEKETQAFPGVKGAEEKDIKKETSSNEVNYEKLSDTAVGDKIKYVRESLDKKQTVIEKATLFNADVENDKEIVALNDPTKKYYKANFIITYAEKNADDINHREYLSGCIQFVQRDGGLSEHSFWYEGATNQVAQLWEIVAKHKKLYEENLNKYGNTEELVN